MEYHREISGIVESVAYTRYARWPCSIALDTGCQSPSNHMYYPTVRTIMCEFAERMRELQMPVKLRLYDNPFEHNKNITEIDTIEFNNTKAYYQHHY